MWQQSFITIAVPVTMMLTIGALSFILLKAYDLADRINEMGKKARKAK